MQPRIIRVFPPKGTNITPTDPMAFIGNPPMIRPEADEVHVSVTFTWDREAGERLAQAWGQYYPVVKIGGPAYSSPSNDFISGMYVREGVVFTSRGCNRNCPWCLVPLREGALTLLPIQDGHIIQDNNLLQCPRTHITQVMEMLNRQRKGAKFVGGVDARLVDDWFADQLRTIRVDSLFLAADTDNALGPLRSAIDKLGFLGHPKLRAYVLIGFNGESIERAEERLKEVFRMGCLPFAMLYQPPDQWIKYDGPWKALRRAWTRPAAIATIMGQEGYLRPGFKGHPHGPVAQGQSGRLITV